MADVITCPNLLSAEDVIRLAMRVDATGVRYVNLIDSGVDVDDLEPLDCQNNLSFDDIVLGLAEEDGSGNVGFRACILT